VWVKLDAAGESSMRKAVTDDIYLLQQRRTGHGEIIFGSCCCCWSHCGYSRKEIAGLSVSKNVSQLGLHWTSIGTEE
jgi:hypothetical protein